MLLFCVQAILGIVKTTSESRLCPQRADGPGGT